MPLLTRSTLLHSALALLAGAATLPAQAGLSLDQALARHQQLLAADAGAQPGVTEALPPVPNGILLVGGNSIDRLPQLLASPLGLGGSGLRLAHTLADGREGLTVRLGLLGSDEAARHWTLEGTELALRAGPGEAYASVQRRHWGPSWTGSLILDAAAPAVAAVGWRKTSTTAFETPWLAWLGPWNADFFIGGLAGHTQPAHPYLVGMRLQIQPLPSLQLGASRTLQWGGRGRDQSFSSFARGLLGRDNQDDSNTQPGNQLAGFDARWHTSIAQSQQLAIYGQLTGEDEADYLPGKNMKLAGLEWSLQSAGHSLRLFVERANVVAGLPGVAYRHHIYLQGYTQDGRPLGHPAGGDTKLTSVGAVLDMGNLSGELVAYDGRAEPTAQRLVAGSVSGVNAALAWRARSDQTVGLNLWSGRDGGGRDSAAQLWWQYAWR
ncbi:capsule assembly Wzi family protein [Azohydromonas australica]|uniref:capsule assembly Wzi family protein n=1 Tax=Azohydromonas australica TaxID=364039 RepID=UPI00041BCB08|nr:capsule assembly Wzi family protein [Azohydromonas australica]